MSQHERIARIDVVDVATGSFTATLASEGEATDGHILSIKGAQVPERLPLLVSHMNDPSLQAGSIVNPTKELKAEPSRLRVTGQIEMSGEGPTAEIRRDIAHMIDKGHVSAMSVRWDDVPGKAIRRVNLPQDHPYFVDSEKAKGPERYGVFFEEWRAMEGSIVAVGADPNALIGRAEETDGAVSQFWRSMAEDVSQETGEEEQRDEPEESAEAKVAAALAGLRIHVADCFEAGVSAEEIVEAIGEHEGLEAFRLQAEGLELGNEDEPILDPESDTERGADPPAQQVTADPQDLLTLNVEELRKPIDVQALVAVFRESLDEADRRRREMVGSMLRHALGRVT